MRIVNWTFSTRPTVSRSSGEGAEYPYVTWQHGVCCMGSAKWPSALIRMRTYYAARLTDGRPSIWDSQKGVVGCLVSKHFVMVLFVAKFGDENLAQSEKLMSQNTARNRLYYCRDSAMTDWSDQCCLPTRNLLNACDLVMWRRSGSWLSDTSGASWPLPLRSCTISTVPRMSSRRRCFLPFGN